jgi:negative regulator of flagellin synthesis FlgM
MKVGQNTNVEIIASKLQQNAVQQAQQKQAGTAGDAVQSSGRHAQAGVPVTVSSSVRSLDNNAKTSGDVDMSKVLAMRAAIANGTFRVDAGAVADRLLSDAGQFLGGRRA